MYSNGLTNTKKIVIISSLSTILLFLLVTALLLGFSKDNSRTIMIYMSGNNLESNSGLASDDLDGIEPDKINFEKTNVLVYTGGTKKWHNDYISNDENAIYELTKDGFKKVKSYDKSNMGDQNSLKTFLNYCYDNYKTGKYDLVMWDHGHGSLGSIGDEYTGDILFLNEISDALRRSRFNSYNKIETVVFRTCLNGTLEMATILSPYAEYMVASEEVTRGGSGLTVLSFINNVNSTDSGKKFGERFINSYQDQMKIINDKSFSPYDSTYSIINLSKISGLLDRMNTFFGKVDADSNYNDIAKIRSAMHQYAKSTVNSKNVDTIDLYELVDNLKIYSNSDAETLENYLKNEVVEYNWSTNTHSNGLSVYFPYYGDLVTQENHMQLYDYIKTSKNYKKLITQFYKGKSDSKRAYSFDLSDNEIVKEGKEFKLKLSEEEIKNYSRAEYVIFRKEANGYFTPLYMADDPKLDKDGYLTSNMTNNVIMLVDERDNNKSFIFTEKVESTNKDKEYLTSIYLYCVNYDDPTSDSYCSRMDSGTAHIMVDKNNNIYMDKIYIKTDATEDKLESIDSTVVKVDDYTSIQFPIFQYNILDENGNYTTDWESNRTKYLLEVLPDSYHFELGSLNDGEYYCLFKIYDGQGNGYYSNLVSIN